MEINWKKLFEKWEYSSLPIIYQGECDEIPGDEWEKIVALHEGSDDNA